MRAPLFGLVLPFALGIAVEDALASAPALPAAVAALALLLRVLGPRAARGVAGCVALAAAGALSLALRLHAPRPEVGDAAVAWTLEAAPEPLGAGCRARAFVHGKRPGRALVSAPASVCAALPGETLVARLDVGAHRPRTNPGGADPARAWARRGIPARASIRGGAVARVWPEPRGPRSAIERARRAVGNALDPPCADRARAAPLLRALVTGERARLAPDVVVAFRRSGTAHLLAVSGLNIAWVFLFSQHAVAWGLARVPSLVVLRRAGTLARAAGLVAAAAYTALAGLEAPALRAALMAFAGTVAWLGGRPAASWNALAFAALVALAADPSALFDAGFALSFAAVAGLLAWRPGSGRLSSLVGCTLGASAGTAPLLALLGIPLPALSLVANLVAVPWFEGVLALALLAGFAGALLPDAAPLLRLPALAAAEAGVRLLGSLASPDLLASSDARTALALLGAGLAFALRAAGRGRVRVALCIGVASFAVAGLALPLERRDAPDRPELLFLDVGHGSATLVRSSTGAWLVDAGPRLGSFDAGARVVAPALRAEGVRALDALVITHADADHIGGAAAVVEALSVGEVWITAEALATRSASDLRREAARRGVPFRVVASGARAELRDVAIEVLWPPAGAAPGAGNPGALVLRVRAPGTCALLPADVPARVERALAHAVQECDVLALAHHGSRTSSDALWLARVDPDVAIASAGRRAHPLPHPSVRARLAARRITLYETRRFGAIRVRLGPRPVVAPFLAEALAD